MFVWREQAHHTTKPTSDTDVRPSRPRPVGQDAPDQRAERRLRDGASESRGAATYGEAANLRARDTRRVCRTNRERQSICIPGNDSADERLRTRRERPLPERVTQNDANARADRDGITGLRPACRNYAESDAK